MTQSELKDKLIKRIHEIDNMNLLQDFLEILEIDAASSAVVELTADQKSAIARGDQDFKDGDYLLEDESDQQAVQWLEK